MKLESWFLTKEWEVILDHNGLNIIVDQSSDNLYKLLVDWDIFIWKYIKSEKESLLITIDKIFSNDNQILDFVLNNNSKEIIQRLDRLIIKNSWLNINWQCLEIKKVWAAISFLIVDLGDGNTISVFVSDSSLLKDLKKWDFCKLNIGLNRWEYRWNKKIKWIIWYDFVLNDVSNLYPTKTYITKQELSDSISDRFKLRHIDLREDWKKLLLVKDTALKLINQFFSIYWFSNVASPKILWKLVEWPVDSFKVQFFGQDASLAISDILYQILAISGWFNRVYEIWPNFRQDHSKTKMHNSEFNTITFHGVDCTVEFIIDLVNKLMIFLKDSFKDLGISIDESLDISKIPMVEFKDIMKLLNANWYNYEINTFHYIPMTAKDIIEREYGRTIWIVNQSAIQNPFYTKTFIDEEKNYLVKDCELWDTRVTSIANWWERAIEKDIIINRLNEKGLNLDNFDWFIKMYDNGIPPHWWLGMWVDRLLALILWINNVRELKLIYRDFKTLNP